MTTPTLSPETLAALAAAARELVPPYFDADIGVHEACLRVIVRHRRIGPSYGGGRRLDDFGPFPEARDAIAAWVAYAVPYCVKGIISEELRLLTSERNAAREREYRTQGKYVCNPTRGNLQRYSDARYAFQKAQRELEEIARRDFGEGTWIP